MMMIAMYESSSFPVRVPIRLFISPSHLGQDFGLSSVITFIQEANLPIEGRYTSVELFPVYAPRLFCEFYNLIGFVFFANIQYDFPPHVTHFSLNSLLFATYHLHTGTPSQIWLNRSRFSMVGVTRFLSNVQTSHIISEWSPIYSLLPIHLSLVYDMLVANVHQR